jgi:hypothetical protein
VPATPLSGCPTAGRNRRRPTAPTTGDPPCSTRPPRGLRREEDRRNDRAEGPTHEHAYHSRSIFGRAQALLPADGHGLDEETETMLEDRDTTAQPQPQPMDIFTGPVTPVVEESSIRYRRKPSGSSDQGYKED